ncbi:MAG TPA: haloacid dehalogenase type II [Candidatus Angelobacter sp.]|jgi:2-haloacid dehalogenase
MERREFIALTAAGLAWNMLPHPAGQPQTRAIGPREIKAVAFDAFPIFDPRPINALAEELFPGRGLALSNEWRTRQFEYTWLRVAARRYADFWQVTQDALVFAAHKLQLDLSREKRETLMNAYLTLKAWPDVQPAVTALKQSGLRLALLSNFTPRMLAVNIKNAGLDGLFEHVLSTDPAGTYKPDPNGYQLGIDAFRLKRHEILFVAFAGWDAAGAKLFGYPTYWVNRLQLPVEELGAAPDGEGTSLLPMVQFLS